MAQTAKTLDHTISICVQLRKCFTNKTRVMKPLCKHGRTTMAASMLTLSYYKQCRWNHIPVLKHLTGMVAWPRKLGSPNTSSSCTTKRIMATSGFRISNSHDSFQIGLNPLSTESHNKLEHYTVYSPPQNIWQMLPLSVMFTLSICPESIYVRSDTNGRIVGDGCSRE